MVHTPYLNLPKDATLWVCEEDAWWRLNLDHAWLKDAKPYQGVLQAEVLPAEGGHMLTLGVETPEGSSVFSFCVGEQGVRPFEASGEAAEIKALKVAVELLHHLPDDQLRERLSGPVRQRLSQLELTAEQSVWDRL